MAAAAAKPGLQRFVAGGRARPAVAATQVMLSSRLGAHPQRPACIFNHHRLKVDAARLARRFAQKGDLVQWLQLKPGETASPTAACPASM
jgi:hypothetical protein